MKKSELDKKKLKFENTKKNPIQATSKPILRDYVKPVLDTVCRFFYNTYSKVKNLFKKPKKQTKAQKELAKQKRNRGILGIWLLLVIVSIAYSTAVTCMFVNSFASIVALLPQALFAIYTLFKAFSNLYK